MMTVTKIQKKQHELERAALSMTVAMPPRGLRGLGLLNLLQVSETVGSQNNLSISLTSPLMQRGMCWKLA